MARELFAAGFVSCWAELDPASQEQLVRSLEAALASPTIPPGENGASWHPGFALRLAHQPTDYFLLALVVCLLRFCCSCYCITAQGLSITWIV